MIYDRQKNLNLHIPNSVAVIGCGGVGSWVAVNMALTGVKKLILVDFDKVEEHNLNRTLFKQSQIGMLKTEALTQLVYERRKDIEVITINKRIEDCNEYELKEIEESDEIIDCRDTSEELPAGIESKARKITAGYDGFSITLHLNRQKGTVWGDSGHTRYTITPSWLVPPQFLAGLITLYLCNKDIQKNKEKIATFDIRNIFEYIFKEVKNG